MRYLGEPAYPGQMPGFDSWPDGLPNRERIRGPALRTQDEEVYWLYEPERHHDVIAGMRGRGIDPADVANADQGFITTESRYVSREQAWEIADAAKQIKEPERARRPRELFTECMW